jgi:hypothetical protein
MTSWSRPVGSRWRGSSLRTKADWITSTAIADYGTGVAIAWAVTSALYHRERTGQGQMVETTLLSTALAFQGAVVMEHPLADAGMRAPARERRRQIQKEGASYQEMVNARNPARAFGGTSLPDPPRRTAPSPSDLSPTLVTARRLKPTSVWPTLNSPRPAGRPRPRPRSPRSKRT